MSLFGLKATQTQISLVRREANFPKSKFSDLYLAEQYRTTVIKGLAESRIVQKNITTGKET